MSEEIWKPVEGFPGYEVSNHGNVRSYKTRKGGWVWYIADEPIRTLSPTTAKKSGYRGVGLSRNGLTRFFRVAKLVAAAFLGPCPDGLEVCHNDGNPANDHVENLRYDTHRGNMQDAVKQGNMDRGKCKRSLTNEQVEKIRQELSRIGRTHGATKEAYQKVSERVGLSWQMICSIERGETYKEAGGPIRRGKLYNQLSLPQKDVVSIREERSRGASLLFLAEEFGIDPSAISRIVRGITYSDIGGPIQDVDYPKQVVKSSYESWAL